VRFWRRSDDDDSGHEGATEGWSPIEEFSSTKPEFSSTGEIDVTMVMVELILDDYREAAFAAIDECVTELVRGT
jgi:hypothetical protein